MFISITFIETSIDETNKTQYTQIVRRSKFMFKMSTIHANTYISNNYTPLRNRCRDDGGPTASTPSADVLSTPSHHGSAKTNKHIFEIFSPSGSHTILFFHTKRVAIFQRTPPPNGGVECRWGRQKTRFWTNIWLRCIQVYSDVNRTSREV